MYRRKLVVDSAFEDHRLHSRPCELAHGLLNRTDVINKAVVRRNGPLQKGFSVLRVAVGTKLPLDFLVSSTST